jgi:hypothetical protein
MSRIVLILLICHCQKPIVLSDVNGFSLENFLRFTACIFSELVITKFTSTLVMFKTLTTVNCVTIAASLSACG